LPAQELVPPPAGGSGEGSGDIPLADFVPREGERALIVGQTGGGKTAFAAWLLQHVEMSPFVIYDTKIEPKFDRLPASRIVHNPRELNDAIEDMEVDYAIYRPTTRTTTDPDALDNLLQYHYDNLHNIGCYIDELLQFHRNYRAGPGLMSLLTRGRSRGITTIMSTQQPASISSYCYSEAQRFYVFFLPLERNRKRIAEFVPGYDPEAIPPEYGFFYSGPKMAAPRLMKPISLPPGLDSGYTDVAGVQESSDGSDSGPPPQVWI